MKTEFNPGAFAGPALAQGVLESTRKALVRLTAKRGGARPTIMEVCGTHTAAISKMGLRSLLGGNLRLLSGPGCPVCVTDQTDVEAALALARTPGVTLATFGDMLRIPGNRRNLLEERARGGDVRLIHSPLESVVLAARNPRREVVLLGVGFETTAPAVSRALEEAVALGLDNFSIFSAHKLTPPAVRAIVEGREAEIDGFICPGHVSTVIGRKGWSFLGDEFGLPAVVAGFEPVDILLGIDTLVRMLDDGAHSVANLYTRAVREDGNPTALALTSRFFEPVDTRWRGLGLLPKSGLRLRSEFRAFEARNRFELRPETPRQDGGCRCGDVLKGRIIPTECGLWGRGCLPEAPAGPCMVSSEGACAAYFQYRDW
ncbi:MAG: hydrogenase formation protein HypD [Firmicutes bacterium]|nr:hydrogenase formation protein HypD [Bacillota bacterium]